MNKPLKEDDEDSRDINCMFDNIKEMNDVPDDMKCLWDQQKNILNTTKSQGNRWHPK